MVVLLATIGNFKVGAGGTAGNDLGNKSRCIAGLGFSLVGIIICDCLSKNLPSSHLPVFREIPF